jgi:hypothetical protein
MVPTECICLRMRSSGRLLRKRQWTFMNRQRSEISYWATVRFCRKPIPWIYVILQLHLFCLNSYCVFSASVRHWFRQMADISQGNYADKYGKRYPMNGARNMPRWRKKCTYNFGAEGDHFGKLRDRVILKRMLKKAYVNKWTGLYWFRIGPSDGRFWLR